MRNIDDNDCEDDINDGISPPTPGPWKVVTSWYDYSVEGPNGEEIIWQDGPYQTPTIKLSDARLIAAAPELLEALETCLVLMDYGGTWTVEEQNTARAAIAKAKGGQP